MVDYEELMILYGIKDKPILSCLLYRVLFAICQAYDISSVPVYLIKFF